MTATELVIGLVNNMPVAAKRATEQQFVGLLTAAAEHVAAPINVFTVESDARRTAETFRTLRQMQPDALIVTGDEPRRMQMSDEPLWPALAGLVDWAADNTISSVWSCMAAHAAVFRLDAISRARLPRKLSGLYRCTAASDHPLLGNFPRHWLVPHSRHNHVDEGELLDKGYTVLSHAAETGADSFVKPVRGSLFLLLQGHLEYAPDSLFREYRRDIRRFLIGESETYPEMPENYFDRKTARKLAKLRDEAHRAPSPRLLAAVYAVFAEAAIPVIASPAATLYANWLAYLAKEKAERGWSIHQRRGAA